MNIAETYPLAMRIEASGGPDVTPVVLISDTDAGFSEDEMRGARAAIAERNPVVIVARTETGFVAAAVQFQHAVQEAGPRTIH